jgi:hypothetical protein
MYVFIQCRVDVPVFGLDFDGKGRIWRIKLIMTLF